MRKCLIGGAATAAALAIVPAVAQSAQPAPAPAPAPQVLIERAPAARAHTRAEVGTHVRALFERLDSNRDGFITKAEIEAAKAKRGDRTAKRLHRRGGGQPADRNALFDRIDSNRDGYVSRDEFARAPMREERRVVIRNGDRDDRRASELGGRGMRDRRAMGMGGFGSLRGHMFELADSNRDGRVSLQEATAAAYRHFDMADANRDGQITREERMQMHQRMRAERKPG